MRSQIAGKRVAYIACAIILLLFTIGTALAPTITVFVALRVLSGLQGTYFHVAGQTILARYFPPVSDKSSPNYFPDVERFNEEQQQAFSSRVQFLDLPLVSLHGGRCLSLLIVYPRTMHCGHCCHVSELACYLMAAGRNDWLGSHHVIAFHPLPTSLRPKGQKQVRYSE